MRRCPPGFNWCRLCTQQIANLFTQPGSINLPKKYMKDVEFTVHPEYLVPEAECEFWSHKELNETSKRFADYVDRKSDDAMADDFFRKMN